MEERTIPKQPKKYLGSFPKIFPEPKAPEEHYHHYGNIMLSLYLSPETLEAHASEMTRDWIITRAMADLTTRYGNYCPVKPTDLVIKHFLPCGREAATITVTVCSKNPCNFKYPKDPSNYAKELGWYESDMRRHKTSAKSYPKRKAAWDQLKKEWDEFYTQYKENGINSIETSIQSIVKQFPGLQAVVEEAKINLT